MNYDEWRATAVTCSDIRCFGIDGFQDVHGPVPGVAFMTPILGDFRGEPIINSWSCTGYITRDDARGMWDVQIENTEREFYDLEKACRHLWDSWVHSEIFPDPEPERKSLFRLIGIDEFGEMLTDITGDESQCFSQVRIDLQDEEHSSRAIEDLSKIGARFHEFSHGHYAMFPIESIN